MGFGRMKTLEKLEATYADCDRCELSKGRTQLVHWRGSPKAKLLLIGEAPGAKEDEKGVPFVGAAGRLLDGLLIKASLKPSQDVFIINTVACRPLGNRAPTFDEHRACRKRTAFLIDIVRPKAIMLFGATAAKRMAGVGPITAWRGSFTELETWTVTGGTRVYPAMPTFHPSYLMRKGRDPEIQALMISDIQEAWRVVNER